MGSNLGFRKIFKWDEPNMKVLNDTLKVLWDKLLGNVEYKDFSSGAKKIIDSKAEQTAVDEVSGKVTTLSTEVAQTQEEILLRATKEDLEKVQAELTVTAEAIRSEVSDTADGLQSQIDQQAGQISLSVQTANSAAAAANNAQATADGKLDADAPSVGVNTGSSGGVAVRITKDEFNVDVPGEDGDFRLNADGGFLPVLQAQSVIAPNVAVRYDGGSWIGVNPNYTAADIAKGNRYRSLQEAFDALSNKVVDNYITIQILSGASLYEDARLQGARFLSGCTITTSDSPATASIYGGVVIRHCSGYIKMEYIKFYPADGQSAITAYGKAEFLHMVYCSLYGRAKTTGTYAVGGLISDGASCQVEYCEFYDFSYAMDVASLASLNMQSGNKGNCNLRVRRGFLFVTDAAPSENASEWRYTYNGAHFCNTYNVSVDQGTGGSVTPTTTSTISLWATDSGSYAGSGSRFRSEVGQGWYSGTGRIRGCMWFSASLISELSGRTILSASLRLSMRKGVGRGASVTVELCGTSAREGASNAAVTKSYGVIGTTSPGEVTTITIPNQAVTDLVGGTIRGLMLYSSDAGAYKDRSYSKNYALFDGADAEEDVKPMLTVVYR